MRVYQRDVAQKFKDVNVQVRNQQLQSFALMGKVSPHFIERLNERVLPADRQQLVDKLCQYVLINTATLGSRPPMSTITIETSKYRIVMQLQSGFSTPLNGNDVNITIVNVKTIIDKTTHWANHA